MEEAGTAKSGAASSAPTQRTLVMELVEGPALAERIAGSAVPAEEALPIAEQIAEALCARRLVEDGQALREGSQGQQECLPY